MECKKCKGLCDSGAVFLKDGTVICACCIYEYLGSDNDNGYDWPLGVLEDTAFIISESIEIKPSEEE